MSKLLLSTLLLLVLSLAHSSALQLVDNEAAKKTKRGIDDLDEQVIRTLEEWQYQSSKCLVGEYFSITTLNCEKCDLNTNLGKEIYTSHPCQSYYSNKRISELENQQNISLSCSLFAVLVSILCVLIVVVIYYKCIKPDIARTTKANLEKTAPGIASSDTTLSGTQPIQRKETKEQGQIRGNGRPEGDHLILNVE